jgi:hypothetical protein
MQFCVLTMLWSNGCAESELLLTIAKLLGSAASEQPGLQGTPEQPSRT